MYVEVNGIKLSLNEMEAYTIYSSMLTGLQHSIDTHWVHHPDAYEHHTVLVRSLLTDIGARLGYQRESTLDTLKSQLDAGVKAIAAAKEKQSNV